MTKTLRAFHGKRSVKKRYVDRVDAHRRADEIVQGKGWDSDTHRGCAVGCIFDDYNHTRGPVEIGFPEELLHLADVIHENLPRDVSIPADRRKKSWTQRFIIAAKEGADLRLVWPQLAVWLMTDPRDGVIRFAGDSPRVADSIKRVSALWQRVADGESRESLAVEFAAASDAARAAARATASDAASDAASTASDAASDAAWAARATMAATMAATSAAEWAATWGKIANKLIKLMKSA